MPGLLGFPRVLREGVGVAELPSGTVTFLFTDLEGSTRLWEQFPDVMQPALGRHDAILRAAVVGFGGAIVKGTGDGVHGVFATAQAAVSAAVAMQLGIADEDFGGVGELRVRMGLHSGVAEIRDGDYYGPSVNRAARVMSAAHGGQIVVSHATEELLTDSLPDGLRAGGSRGAPVAGFGAAGADLPAVRAGTRARVSAAALGRCVSWESSTPVDDVCWSRRGVGGDREGA